MENKHRGQQRYSVKRDELPAKAKRIKRKHAFPVLTGEPEETLSNNAKPVTTKFPLLPGASVEGMNCNQITIVAQLSVIVFC